jgi:hypothetical protein
MASTYLTRTQSTGNRTTFTFSAWVKRSGFGTQHLITCGASSTYMTQFQFNSADQLQFYNNDNGTTMHLQSNRVFRDTNAWYHIMLRFDTTQSTTNDRIRFYVNGEQVTSFATQSQPTQNADNTQFNYNGVAVDIGRRHHDNSDYFNGSMSHVNFCDGQSYAPTSFGETDTTTGEWKAKTSPSVTYGNNGFFILKDGNGITDQSGEGNDFTLGGGTLTDLKDNPDNTFATMNPLVAQSGFSFSQGNNTITWSTSNKSTSGTLGMVTGKYYWEMKFSDATGGANAMIGVGNENFNHDSYNGSNAGGWAYYSQGGKTYHSSSFLSYGSDWTAGDIIGVAFNADTRTIWFSKNGTWQDSATISEIGSGTTTNSAYTGMGSAGDTFFPVISAYSGNVCQFNFGNGYFGTTAISSAGTNASENGIFEYDVPTGYTALSTKGLNL